MLITIEQTCLLRQTELGQALSNVPNECGLEKLLSSDSHVSVTAAE
jgi:hypothetical protein